MDSLVVQHGVREGWVALRWWVHLSWLGPPFNDYNVDCQSSMWCSLASSSQIGLFTMRATYMWSLNVMIWSQCDGLDRPFDNMMWWWKYDDIISNIIITIIWWYHHHHHMMVMMILALMTNRIVDIGATDLWWGRGACLALSCYLLVPIGNIYRFIVFLMLPSSSCADW